MQQTVVNQNFTYGYDRTCDVAEALPDSWESICELVGVIVGANEALAIRWGVDEKEALKRVRRLL